MSTNNWISVNHALPENFIRVKWLYKNGKEDIGIWNDGNFLTFDIISDTEITHWKPYTINK